MFELFNRKNIWDKDGCKLPNDKLCDACCVPYEVALGNYVKPSDTICPYQNRNHAGEGCDKHGEFIDCNKFKCPSVDPNMNLEIIAVAHASGQVTEEEATDAVKRLAKNIQQEHLTDSAIDFMQTNSQKYKKLFRKLG